jgi:excisionase family DNA binding protein
MQHESGNVLVSFPEAARRLGVDPRTLRRAAKLGQVKSIQLGRRWLIPRANLEKLLNQARVEKGNC